MSTEVQKEVELEIGHILFIDIVGYSKLLINQQSEQLEMLKTIVRGTEQFKEAEADGKLLRLPTGDGGALVFRTTPEAPVLCALETAEALKAHPPPSDPPIPWLQSVPLAPSEARPEQETISGVRP